MHPSDPTLNDYVEDALSGDTRLEVERHLEGCEACRTLVDDLRAIRQAASALPPVPPPPRVWQRIDQSVRGVARDAARPSRARWRPAGPQLGWLGLAAAVVLAAGIGMWMKVPAPATPAGGAAASAAGGSIESVESEIRLAEEHYTRAISGLEQIANEGQGELDPETAATLQKSLAVVDQAIDESRAAVRSEPTSESAQQSLLENFSTKIALLQDTVSLINEMRKGNDAGAAQIVSGLK